MAGTRKTHTPAGHPQYPWNHCRELILVDQEPLRRGAVEECHGLIQRSDQARAQIRRFEEVDQPAYARWMALTFGARLSEIRVLQSAVEDLESFIAAVEWNVRTRGESHASACLRIERARAGVVEPPQVDDPDAETGKRPGSKDLDEWEQELLYEEMLHDTLGIDPSHLDEKAYEEGFRQFQEAFDFKRDEEEFDDFPPSTKRPEPTPRLKELYRQLVRLLHPDLRADGDPRVSALWHDVQAAYEAGDVERLETLLAYSGLQDGTISATTPLSKLYSLIQELRSGLRALLKTVRDLKKSNAWDFENRPRTKLERELHNGMEEEVAWLNEQKAHFEGIIAHWKAPNCR